MSSNENELAARLFISFIPGVGPKRYSALLNQYPSFASLFNDRSPTQEFWQACENVGIPSPMRLDWQSVDEALSWQNGKDKHLLIWESAHFPSQLMQIASCPPVLFVQGQPELLSTMQLGVVGSRRPTDEGARNAFQFAFELARHGFTITSGLALGIDGASHEGALKAKGKTIAVLGQGLDDIYPKRHQSLAAQIVENGALVSEFPLDARPLPEHFPRRNRIISGLSRGVLVVESSHKSGSLITAKYALEQNREIYAIPGSIHNPLSKGCHHLIRQGAKCVDKIQDILEEFPEVSRFPQIELPIDPYDSILLYFSERVMPIDLLIQKSGLTAERVSSMLIELELQGKVASVPGGYSKTVAGGAR